MDVYSFAITALEIGCRDHGYVVGQISNRGRIASVDVTDQQTGFRPEPKEEFAATQPDLWGLIQECWARHPRDRPTFVGIAHRIKKMDPAHGAEKSRLTTTKTSLFSDTEARAAEEWNRKSGKRYVAFLSHHKEACATEARLVKGELEGIFDAEAFLGTCAPALTMYSSRLVLAAECDESAFPSPRTQIRTTSGTSASSSSTSWTRAC